MDPICTAYEAGVLDEREAFCLEALADDEDNNVPPDLFDAVERLSAWLLADDTNNAGVTQ